MADVHSPAIRSKNMRAISNRDTAIERRIEAILNALELPFHMQDSSLAGRPDFVIDAFRCVIFTHGCFWHQHQCAMFKLPATRREFWQQKISANAQRDARHLAWLTDEGWRVLIVWECALRGRHKLTEQALSERLDEWLCAGTVRASLDSHGLHQL